MPDTHVASEFCGLPPPDPLNALAEALAAHREGRLDVAARGYGAVLDAAPDHPLALRLLGLLHLARGELRAARERLGRAVEAAPEDADARTAWADATAALGEMAAAIAAYRMVLRDHPGQQAARVNLANALRQSGDAAGAITECRIALATAPRLLQAHVTLGASLLTAGKVIEAIGAYRTAVGIAPESVVARTGYAMALLRERRAVDALDAALRACEMAPEFAEAWFVRGAAERALQRYLPAKESLAQALALAPSHAHARLALGNTLADLDDLAGAEGEVRAAIALDPSLPEAHASLGFLLTARGDTAGAIAACDAAIAIAPDFARAYWNRSSAYLLDGDFARGFADYEERRRDPMFAADFAGASGPEWDGAPLAGRRLLVLAEQGLGDTIQFARFLPALADRGGRVILACAPTLIPLLRGLPGIADIVSRDAPPPLHDCFVFQMSLPRLLGTTVTTIPMPDGYLTADPARALLPPDRSTVQRRIGLAWAGNPEHHNDARRSIPTRALAPLVALEGIEWVNLQRGARGPELTIMHRLPAPSARITDFADTAALVDTLDLVIAVDTSVAHLAGAMGTPVWVLLPHAPDWRWMLHREDTPWYSSARLFRQRRAGDWDEVIARVAAALDQGGRGSG